jgi:hypothetical protein
MSGWPPSQAHGMRDGYLRGALPAHATQRQIDVLADLRARSGLTTEQLIYAGRASGGLVVPSLEPR